MDITPNLVPFWHEPYGQDAVEPSKRVRFRLRPLTQPQVSELFSTFELAGENLRRPTTSTWYAAGCMGLDGAAQDGPYPIENLTINGQRARWPRDKNVIPHGWISSCGVKLCTDAWGDDAGETEKN
jgi:hypothetical protein